MDPQIVLYVAVVSLFLTVVVFLFFYNETQKIKKQLALSKISNNENVSLIQRVKLCEEKINNVKSFISSVVVHEKPIEKAVPVEVPAKVPVEEQTPDDSDDSDSDDSELEVEME